MNIGDIMILPSGDRYTLYFAANGKLRWVRTLTHPQTCKTEPAIIEVVERVEFDCNG